MLSFQNLRKVYQDGTVALDGFNWDLQNGVYGLLGPNGAGKSTLLEILSMNLMPISGKVLWKGQNIQKKPLAFRRILGYLPQEYGFYPELKARQFLGYMGRLQQLHGRTLKRRISEVLELVNLEEVGRRKIKTFSGGMRQRLAIAQALIHSPKLLVVDEPTTGLDPGERIGFRNLLFDLGRSCVVLLSTHIVKDVEFSCHEMSLLYGGRQSYTGPPVDFVKRAEGRVCELEIPRSEFERFSKAHHMIAIQERGEIITARFLENEGEKAIPGSRPVKPNLEDAYVDFIRERKEEEHLAGAA